MLGWLNVIAVCGLRFSVCHSDGRSLDGSPESGCWFPSGGSSVMDAASLLARALSLASPLLTAAKMKLKWTKKGWVHAKTNCNEKLRLGLKMRPLQLKGPDWIWNLVERTATTTIDCPDRSRTLWKELLRMKQAAEVPQPVLSECM